MITTNITTTVITTTAKMAPTTPPAIAPADPPALPPPGATHYVFIIILIMLQMHYNQLLYTLAGAKIVQDVSRIGIEDVNTKTV